MEKEQLIKWIQRLLEIRKEIQGVPFINSEIEKINHLLGYIESAEFIIKD